MGLASFHLLVAQRQNAQRSLFFPPTIGSSEPCIGRWSRPMIAALRVLIDLDETERHPSFMFASTRMTSLTRSLPIESFDLVMGDYHDASHAFVACWTPSVASVPPVGCCCQSRRSYPSSGQLPEPR